MKKIIILLPLIASLSSCQPEEKNAQSNEQEKPKATPDSDPTSRDGIARLRAINEAAQESSTSSVGVLFSKEDIQLILITLQEKDLQALSKSDKVTLQQALFLGATTDESDLDQILLDKVRDSIDADQSYRTMLLQIIEARKKLNKE